MEERKCALRQKCQNFRLHTKANTCPLKHKSSLEPSQARHLKTWSRFECHLPTGLTTPTVALQTCLDNTVESCSTSIFNLFNPPTHVRSYPLPTMTNAVDINQKPRKVHHIPQSTRHLLKYHFRCTRMTIEFQCGAFSLLSTGRGRSVLCMLLDTRVPRCDTSDSPGDSRTKAESQDCCSRPARSFTRQMTWVQSMQPSSWRRSCAVSVYVVIHTCFSAS